VCALGSRNASISYLPDSRPAPEGFDPQKGSWQIGKRAFYRERGSQGKSCRVWTAFSRTAGAIFGEVEVANHLDRAIGKGDAFHCPSFVALRSEQALSCPAASLR
jgi:hypothetical protein